jgi:hypothetical protein
MPCRRTAIGWLAVATAAGVVGCAASPPVQAICLDAGARAIPAIPPTDYETAVRAHACRASDRPRPDVAILRRIPLLAGLPAARLKLLAYTAETIHFGPGEVIVHEGDPADAVGIIAAGGVEVVRTNQECPGRHLWTLGPHDLFDETAVLCGTPRGATVRATDHVAVLRIPAVVFLGLVRQHAELGCRS